MTTIITLIVAAVTFGTVLMYGTLGEILTEKAGNLNLGVEGIMYMGGAFGLAGAFYYEKAAGAAASGPLAIILAIIAAFAAGAAASAIYSFLTITLRANQNVTGLALSIFGTGIGQFVGEFMRVSEGGVFFYMAVVVAVLMFLFLKKTRYGMYLTAVGESPATSDAAGINITKYKYIATIIGGGISAIGGMVYIMTTAGCVWNHEGLSGVGWLAVALVIFCIWRPLNAIWGSVLFGAMMIMYLRISIPFIPTEIYKILPYIVTVIVLILTSMKNSRDKQPPASLGINYFREER